MDRDRGRHATLTYDLYNCVPPHTHIEKHMQRKRGLGLCHLYISVEFSSQYADRATMQQAAPAGYLVAQGPKVLGTESFPGVLLTRTTVSLRFPSYYIKKIEIKAMS